ncbi:MAG: hypothetical protein ACREUN_05040 [Burkholderiales bacterium]
MRLAPAAMPIPGPRYKYTRFIAEGAPETPGLYALWEQGELVYLGRAASDATIRERLLAHLDGQGCPCLAGATHYSWELSLEPATREVRLLREFRNEFGRLPRCNGGPH